LYQGGNIVLNGEWHYDNSTNTVELSVAQTGTDEHRFSVEVEFGVYGADDVLPTIHRMLLSDGSGQLSIPQAGNPDRVVIDPRTVLLAQWTLVENTR
jgi:hypothetical protein